MSRELIKILSKQIKNIDVAAKKVPPAIVKGTEQLPETKVINIREEKPDVYIGRGSIWGNPFKIGVHGTRHEVIRKYEEWVKKQPHLLERVKELKGKRLGCFCAPLPCHGDVLKRLADEAE